nr:DUF1566 domain-containing protein [Cryomorphaceae bacterium]
KMSYQAIVRDGSNALVTSTTVGMQISILQTTATGTAVYVETQTPTTNANGLVSLEIGTGTVVSGDFTTIDWSNDSYFIKTETDPTGGTSYTITGTSQLLSVPYALHAKTAESITGGITHYVGELFGGGIVVAVWKESGVEKGLIASLTDVSASAQYSSITGTLIGATAQSPIDGQANTTAIVAQGDVSGAAYLCANYTSGGFSDWYLPAAWELNQCYNAAFVVNTILGATNGFQFAYYWSSTENNNNGAWYQDFNGGGASNDGKDGNFRVRAVRRF